MTHCVSEKHAHWKNCSCFFGHAYALSLSLSTTPTKFAALARLQWLWVHWNQSGTHFWNTCKNEKLISWACTDSHALISQAQKNNVKSACSFSSLVVSKHRMRHQLHATPSKLHCRNKCKLTCWKLFQVKNTCTPTFLLRKEPLCHGKWARQLCTLSARFELNRKTLEAQLVTWNLKQVKTCSVSGLVETQWAKWSVEFRGFV